ncbi:MAG TPA: serine kinase [Bacteroidales bacterium]|nr:serine kinase [Bacteroidales bacterium]HPL04964.1 serine kinase [Bacteroidales bacterium]HPX76916.1 serine kinase [Bacteroidales bacterium]
MLLKDIIEKLELKVLNLANENVDVKDAYASDLLSDVMGKSKAGQIWITLQTHKNVSAICSLKDLAAVVIIGNGQPDPDMLEHAKEEEVCVLSTPDSCFNICGKLYELIK